MAAYYGLQSFFRSPRIPYFSPIHPSHGLNHATATTCNAAMDILTGLEIRNCITDEFFLKGGERESTLSARSRSKRDIKVAIRPQHFLNFHTDLNGHAILIKCHDGRIEEPVLNESSEALVVSEWESTSRKSGGPHPENRVDPIRVNFTSTPRRNASSNS